MQNFDFSSLSKKWPSSVVAREKVSEFSGGILNPRTLANLDSKGEGPKRIRVGRKIAYEVNELCNWLATRSQEVK